MAIYKIEKAWDGNECVTERGNRVYVSNGRWQWLVINVDTDSVESCHDLKREARARVLTLITRTLNDEAVR